MSSDGLSGRLGQAAEAAAAAPATPASEVVQPCPLRERWAIEVRVEGNDKRPVAAVAVRLAKGAQSILGALTGADGLVRFDGLPAGSYTITLPELDAEAWRALAVEALAPDKAKSSGDADWGAPPSDGEGPGSWTIAPGDCLASVAFATGFAKDTVWNYGANSELASRRSSGYDLEQGDVLHIPKKRQKTIQGQTGNRYPVQLVDVPERLKIRFVRVNLKPKENEPYLLEVTAADGSPLPARQGSTDGAGFLDEPIPPNAAEARVLLGRKPGQIEYLFRLGEMNPPTEWGGVQRRLINLGYLDDEVTTGEPDEPTKQALLRLQSDYDLQATGELDAPTKAKIQELFLS